MASSRLPKIKEYATKVLVEIELYHFDNIRPKMMAEIIESSTRFPARKSLKMTILDTTEHQVARDPHSPPPQPPIGKWLNEREYRAGVQGHG